MTAFGVLKNGSGTRIQVATESSWGFVTIEPDPLILNQWVNAKLLFSVYLQLPVCRLCAKFTVLAVY